MIHVWYKEPGKIGKDRWIKNELHVFQQLVGGYIEVVRLQKSPDYCLIVNEEGFLNDMPLNLVVGEKFPVWTHHCGGPHGRRGRPGVYPL